MAAQKSRILVIGVGHPDRGDDAVGKEVVALMQRMNLPGVVAEHMNGEIAALIDRIEGVPAVFFVDAALSGALPGKVRRIDVAKRPLPRESLAASTHGLGLAQAIELARSLGQLPPTCIVYAIEGAQFEVGAPLSGAIERAAQQVAEQLRQEIVAMDSPKVVGNA
jgi:hydrogenase maturation protease